MLVSSLRCKVVCISKPFAIASLRMQAHAHARNHTSVQQNHVGSSFTFKHKEADDQMQARKQPSLSCVCISLENGFLGKIRPFHKCHGWLGSSQELKRILMTSVLGEAWRKPGSPTWALRSSWVPPGSWWPAAGPLVCKRASLQPGLPECQAEPLWAGPEV